VAFITDRAQPAGDKVDRERACYETDRLGNLLPGTDPSFHQVSLHADPPLKTRTILILRRRMMEVLSEGYANVGHP
jgi:hypothetical protein